MKERPILFNGEMVKAILAGNKTQTRRVRGLEEINKHPDQYAAAHQDGLGDWIFWASDRPGLAEFTTQAYPNGGGVRCPYGAVGDRLWVRETWMCDEYGRRHQSQGMVHYRADAESLGTWRPSIFMPRWASRITLEITSVRVQRVRDISEMDAQAEGAELHDAGTYCNGFLLLWDSINAKRGYGWKSNPWVWALTFRPD